MDRYPLPGDQATRAAFSAMGWPEPPAPEPTELPPPTFQGIQLPAEFVGGVRPEPFRFPTSGLRPEAALGTTLGGVRPERTPWPTSGLRPEPGVAITGWAGSITPAATGNEDWYQQQVAQFGGGAAPGGAPGAGLGAGVGSGAWGTGTIGGEWTGVERWSTQINAAAAKYGVDPALVKAVMKLESNGDPNAAGSAGVWGPMQVNSNAWGYGPWMTDPVANIEKGVEILKYYLDRNGGNAYEALRGYHGYGSDGNTTDQQYANIVMGNYQQVQALGGGAPSGGGNALATMFGTGVVPEWGEFGAESTLGYYAYGRDYGLTGTQHTGVDLPLPVNSPMRAAFSGTVVCAGTGIGNGQDSCDRFAYINNFDSGLGSAGAGRIQIMSDDGNVMLIYGHAYGSNVTPGQRVNVGTILGTSGGHNSAHVHLEARVRDASTPSGWRIVDPRTVGGYTGGGAPVYEDFTTKWLRAYYAGGL